MKGVENLLGAGCREKFCAFRDHSLPQHISYANMVSSIPTLQTATSCLKVERGCVTI